MSDDSSFDKIWAEKADEELFDALAHRDQYKLEAIEAVQRQIERRNLDSRRIRELEAVAANTKEEELVRAQKPLQWPLRILMLILSFGIFQAILGEYYRNRGYTRRSQEVWQWMVYGLLFWLVIFLLRVLLSLL